MIAQNGPVNGQINYIREDNIKSKENYDDNFGGNTVYIIHAHTYIDMIYDYIYIISPTSKVLPYKDDMISHYAMKSMKTAEFW